MSSRTPNVSSDNNNNNNKSSGTKPQGCPVIKQLHRFFVFFIPNKQLKLVHGRVPRADRVAAYHYTDNNSPNPTYDISLNKISSTRHPRPQALIHIYICTYIYTL